MSAKKVQTLAGPSSKPSAKLADTTSASAGKKQRKAPTKASEMASNGGDNWTLAEVSYSPSIMRYVETDHVHRIVSSGRLGGSRGLPGPTRRLAISSVALRKPAASGSISFSLSTGSKVMKVLSDGNARLVLWSRRPRRRRERRGRERPSQMRRTETSDPASQWQKKPALRRRSTPLQTGP